MRKLTVDQNNHYFSERCDLASRADERWDAAQVESRSQRVPGLSAQDIEQYSTAYRIGSIRIIANVIPPQLVQPTGGLSLLADVKIAGKTRELQAEPDIAWNNFLRKLATRGGGRSVGRRFSDT